MNIDWFLTEVRNASVRPVRGCSKSFKSFPLVLYFQRATFWGFLFVYLFFLAVAKTLSHAPVHFASVTFKIGYHIYSQARLDHNSPTYIFLVAGITGMHYYAQHFIG
jgi:hypothetical protein